MMSQIECPTEQNLRSQISRLPRSFPLFLQLAHILEEVGSLTSLHQSIEWRLLYILCMPFEWRAPLWLQVARCWDKIAALREAAHCDSGAPQSLRAPGLEARALSARYRAMVREDLITQNYSASRCKFPGCQFDYDLDSVQCNQVYEALVCRGHRGSCPCARAMCPYLVLSKGFCLVCQQKK